MDLNTLFNAVTTAVGSHAQQQQAYGGNQPQGMDTGAVLGQLAGLFQQHANATGQQIGYDPQTQAQFGHILPASQDPYGDPADQQQGVYQQGFNGNVLPASQDPLGDPADEQMPNNANPSVLGGVFRRV